MPTATTEVTYDFSVTGPAAEAAEAEITSLLQPYKDAGIISEFPNWTPDMASYPPSTGVYAAIRIWTDSTSAQTFVNAANAWLTANPTPYASQFTIQIQS
jgi:hypothetical protein